MLSVIKSAKCVSTDVSNVLTFVLCLIKKTNKKKQTRPCHYLQLSGQETKLQFREQVVNLSLNPTASVIEDFRNSLTTS